MYEKNVTESPQKLSSFKQQNAVRSRLTCTFLYSVELCRSENRIKKERTSITSNVPLNLQEINIPTAIYSFLITLLFIALQVSSNTFFTLNSFMTEVPII